MTDKDELREHKFDGIQEYDNDLPRWWLWLFCITIIFSVIYPFVYDFGPGQFASETLDQEMLALAEKNQKRTSTGVSEDFLITLAKNSEVLNKGSAVYTAKCLACHADKGAGLVGPNLADDYWIHGGKITDVHKVIANGVLEKGMLAWKDQLSADDLNAVTVYIWSLNGLKVNNPKPPQGELVKR